MPWTAQDIEAQLFFAHNGVSIYHVYKYDQIDSGARTFSFVTKADEGEMESFDVRDLSTWIECPHPPHLCGDDDTPKNREAWDKWHEEKVEEKFIKAALKEAIEKGELTAEGINENG